MGPPVPIDEIVEFHLGLAIEFSDMRELFTFADLHGALWMAGLCGRFGFSDCN